MNPYAPRSRRPSFSRSSILLPLLLALGGSLLGSGCAEELGDIDRTQANYLKKTDLDGTWYYLQTVVGVPPTSVFTFIGETSVTEKIRWRIQEKYLVGYRAYPRVPGAEAPATAPADLYGPDYTENPVVAYRIEKHFDRTREYNSSTGEQSNVIGENDTDRPWFEREFVRVDWSENLVTNFDFISQAAQVTNLQYFVPEEAGGEDALYRESAGGRMNYFDYVGKMFVQPDEYGCWYTWMGWSAEDCTAGEIKVRHSFALAPEDPDYEPFQYDDNLMSKFGYFRSERVTYDPQRGETDSGRRYMIQRHNIWQQTYEKDDQGQFRRDPQGRKIPIPISSRTVRTIPYYLSESFPADPELHQAAVETMEVWDQAAREGVAALQQTRPSAEGGPDASASAASVGRIFVLCQNPVQEGDDPACGKPGFRARFGDLRRSVLHWVDTNQLEGPLGYGPSAADPVTGEIISGKAHVYGAAIDTYSSYVVDVVRFLNHQLPAEDLIEGTHFSDELYARLFGELDPEQIHPALSDVPVTAGAALRAQAGPSGRRMRPEHAAGAAGRVEKLQRRLQAKVEKPRPYSPQAQQARFTNLVEAGLGERFLNEEVRQVVAGRRGVDPAELNADELGADDPARWLNPYWVKQQHKLFKRALARNVEFSDFLETSALGIARAYQQETDLDKLWHTLRALQFKAAAIHEVGHTVGLRHNFQGSYDSLNYFDRYWQQREQTLTDAPSTCCPACATASCASGSYCVCGTGECRPSGGPNCEGVSCEPGQICDAERGGCVDYPQGALTYGDLYQMSRLTEEQTDGRMRDYQYSSIMDYGYSFHSDLMGLGKYDIAAIAFGYGCGHDLVSIDDARCDSPDGYPGPGGLSCLVPREGPVQVFAKNRGELGHAGELLTSTETHFDHTVRFDDTNIPNVNILERCHYTSVARAFPTLADLQQRRWMRYDDYRAAVQAGERNPSTRDGGPVRVPYAFCSDEWSEQMLSCQLFDQGADPFEMTRTHADHWRSYYYFDNFRRNRFGWDPWNVLIRTYERDFLPLSDYYQFWWFAEDGYDPVFDQYFEMAAYTAFDLLAEAVAVPSYGTYCHGKDGTLVPLADDPSRRDKADYAEKAYCLPDGEQVEIHQGEGRRRLSRFAFDSGYYSYDRPLEAGHWWTTTAAIWALTDPDASVIGVDADSGTYAITFFDLFGDEFSQLSAGVVADVPSLIGPLTTLAGDLDSDGFSEGHLSYRPAAPLWVPTADGSDWQPINPETGALVDLALPGSGPSQGQCLPCTADAQCLGYTGNLGGVYCQPLSEQGEVYYCLQDCTDNPGACGDGETCDDAGNCVPTDGLCKPHGCSPTYPFGRCPEGSTCQEGACQASAQLTRTDPTLMLVDDVLFWGLMMTTSGYELRYNDGFKVFRLGTNEEETADDRDFTRVTFTDPVGGQQYGALQPRCDAGTGQGGPAGLCSPCDDSSECNGYVGNYYGGTFCEADRAGRTAVCLQDCGGGTEGACPAGTTCTGFDDGEAYCIPEAETCLGQRTDCAPDSPRGDCPAGTTCGSDGVCAAPFVPSARCRNLNLPATPGVVMVQRGQELSQRYLAALDAYYSNQDPAREEQLMWDYYGAKWSYDGLMVNLNLLRTYFSYLGNLF